MSDSTIEANNLIGDQWVRGIGDAFERRTPAGDRVVCEGHQASVEQVDSAIASAKLAFESWSELPLDDRFAFVRKFAEVLTEKKEQLARLICTRSWKTAVGSTD